MNQLPEHCLTAYNLEVVERVINVMSTARSEECFRCARCHRVYELRHMADDCFDTHCSASEAHVVDVSFEGCDPKRPLVPAGLKVRFKSGEGVDCALYVLVDEDEDE